METERGSANSNNICVNTKGVIACSKCRKPLIILTENRIRTTDEKKGESKNHRGEFFNGEFMRQGKEITSSIKDAGRTSNYIVKVIRFEILKAIVHDKATLNVRGNE